ncbi:MAG: leucine-rich repeat domain-containing protein [Clostridia bacterium]
MQTHKYIRSTMFYAVVALVMICLAAGCADGLNEKREVASTIATAVPDVLNLSDQGLTDVDLTALMQLTPLKILDLRGNELSAAAMEPLLTALPNCKVVWSVPIGSERFDSDLSALSLPEVEADALELLRFFPNLISVDATSCTCWEAVAQKAREMPEITFIWEADVCGVQINSADRVLDLANATSIDESALTRVLAVLPNLTSVNLAGKTLTDETMTALNAARPDVTFLWSFDLYGVTVSSDMTELDLSGKEIIDLAELTKKLHYLPKLTKVDMCSCGTTNEQMEGLMAEFPNIKFVWMIQVGAWEVRTDTKAFSTGNRKSWDGGRFTGKGSTNLTNEDLAVLKYCTDMVAFDVGHHRKITDISVITNFKNLRFLVLSMTTLTDISPVVGLEKLEYIECFQNYITDISPLLKLPNLTHLNCGTNGNITNIDLLIQMPQLQWLWAIRCGLSDAQIDALKAALPNCTIKTSGYNSGLDGWRDNDKYREMQKLFNLKALE